MKSCVTVILMVLAMSIPASANSNLVAYWDFNGSTADLSGNGVAADGTLSGGAAIVADPLAIRDNVLNVPLGGKMTTAAAAEPKFDSPLYAAISLWVYAPNATGWWSYTVGKGGSGNPRIFVDWNPNGNTYFFDYSDFPKTSGAGIFNSSVGAWGGMSNDGWHHIGAQIYPYVDGDGNPGFMNEIYQDGSLAGYAKTQDSWEYPTTMILNDALFEIAPNADWRGYVDDVAVWNGYADASVWAALAGRNVSVQNANFVPEPCTMILLGLGALALRRKS